MPLYSKVADNIDEVDVIIAGGGTAGCIVAGRLAEADPGLSILVIEGGPNNHNELSIVTPIFYLSHLQPTSGNTIFYKGNKAPELADREPIVPAGGVLGGGSSINFMMYTRPQRSDLDSWNMPGWSADELLPFMKKLETYHGPDEKSRHGHSGPVHVSRGTYTARASEDDFLHAASKFGYAELQDLQDLDTIHGMQRWRRYVSPEGKRQDTAHAYVHPKLESGSFPELHILVEAKVVRVLFDQDKRAVGVEYTPSAAAQPLVAPNIDATERPLRQVRARKMVVLSAGACGTPLVLERSGVGNSAVLERAGVKTLEHLPGVGNDYQDHHFLVYPYFTNLPPEDTMDAILAGRVDAQTLFATKDPRLGWNAIDVCSKLRLTEAEVAALGPEFKAAWDRDFKYAPDRLLALMGIVSGFLGDPTAVPPGQYITCGGFTAYPYSRGHMHITGPSVDDQPDFDTGFLSDPHDFDLKVQMWLYKTSREVMRRTKMYRGELAPGHPQFPPGSKAACVQLEKALDDAVVANLEYTAEDDEAIEAFVRRNVNTTWHSLGTCKMAPREQDGVVDQNLSVYGLQGLKIADISIAPKNVGGNVCNAAMMIGEKAADIIIRELGLGGR